MEPSSVHPHSEGNSSETNLIINYLPPNYRESELSELFSKCGPLTKVKVICKKDTDESMTYGFVKYQYPRDAETALRELNGREVEGKKIKVSYARRGLDASNSKVFIKKIPPQYTFGDVHSLFLQFGEIIETRLLMDNQGNSRQIAFIQYSSRHEADAAIAQMSDVIPPGGTYPLIVRHALQPKTYHDTGSETTSDSHEQHAPPSAVAPQNPLPPPPRVSQNNHIAAASSASSSVPATTAPHQTSSRGSHSQSHPHTLSHHQHHSLPNLNHSHPHSNPHHHSYPLSHSQVASPATFHRVGGSSTMSHHTPLEPPPMPQYLIYVTIDNVPTNFDLMSFIFLANYGQVIEGKAETQDFQIFHDGIPYLYRTYTGVYSFTLIVEKDRDVTNLMALNMATVAIKGHYLQVKVSMPLPSFFQFPPSDPGGPFG